MEIQKFKVLGKPLRTNTVIIAYYHRVKTTIPPLFAMKKLGFHSQDISITFFSNIPFRQTQPNTQIYKLYSKIYKYLEYNLYMSAK